MSCNISSDPMDPYTVDYFLGGQISRIHRRKMDFMSFPSEPLSNLVYCAFGPTCKGMPDIPVVEPEDAHASAIAQWV